MTIKQAIDYASEMKPHAFSAETLLGWINALEGRIGLDVFLMSPLEVRRLLQYTKEDMNAVLLVEPPHDDIYTLWLQAKIDEANGEYDKYQNSMQIYNEHYGNFVRWFARFYEPAQGYLGEERRAGLIRREDENNGIV